MLPEICSGRPLRQPRPRTKWSNGSERSLADEAATRRGCPRERATQTPRQCETRTCYNPIHALYACHFPELAATVLRRVFKAFQYRDFRLMWIGACTSSIGTWMQIVAQAWLVLKLSNSPFLLGLDAFLGGIPIFLFSLIGGVVADRIERRKVLLISQCV